MCSRWLSQQEAVLSPEPRDMQWWGPGVEPLSQASSSRAIVPGSEQVLSKCFYVIRAVWSWAIPFASLGLTFLTGTF